MLKASVSIDEIRDKCESYATALGCLGVASCFRLPGQDPASTLEITVNRVLRDLRWIGVNVSSRRLFNRHVVDGPHFLRPSLSDQGWTGTIEREKRLPSQHSAYHNGKLTLETARNSRNRRQAGGRADLAAPPLVCESGVLQGLRSLAGRLRLSPCIPLGANNSQPRAAEASFSCADRPAQETAAASSRSSSPRLSLLSPRV
jgi:hypothetical protein